jgi:chromate reductase, NAD(P)H dehydrogenase (quinone)
MSKAIQGLAGSLRRASFNAGLLRAAAELAPEGGRGRDRLDPRRAAP